jgi:hypothetical protein
MQKLRNIFADRSVHAPWRTTGMTIVILSLILAGALSVARVEGWWVFCLIAFLVGVVAA